MTVPAAGRRVPARVFNRVVFPAPMGVPPCSSEAESLGEAYQADAVAGGDVEGDAGQQQTRADAHVDITNSDHEKTLRTSKRTHGWRESGSSARKFGA
ncbi:hypothetical protein GCM10027074_64020 [Streptomyces deserti]